MSGRDDNDTRRTCGPDSEFAGQFKGHQGGTRGGTSGRWPANLILDSEAAAMLDENHDGRDGGASRFFFRADYDESDVPVDTDHHRQTNQRSTT